MTAIIAIADTATTAAAAALCDDNIYPPLPTNSVAQLAPHLRSTPSDRPTPSHCRLP